MNIDTKKIELIDWVAQLKDKHSINMLETLKKELAGKKKKSNSRIFGSGKGLIKYIAEDFNAPLDQFKEYQK